MAVALFSGMQKLGKISLILAAIGAINWGLIGLFRWNLVDAIFGGGAFETTSALSRVIYVLVGIAGVALLAFLPSVGERPVTGRKRSAFDRDRTAPTV